MEGYTCKSCSSCNNASPLSLLLTNEIGRQQRSSAWVFDVDNDRQVLEVDRNILHACLEHSSGLAASLY